MKDNKEIKNGFITLTEEDLKIKKYFFNAIKDSRKLKNFKSDRKKIIHILKGISFLDGNSVNYIDYKNNLDLLSQIQHYKISDFIQKLYLDDDFGSFISNNNDIFFVKNDDSIYGSNVRIINSLVSQNPLIEEKIINYTEKNESIEDCRLVFIDDFVGTGETARKMLEGPYKEKTIVAYYIYEETKIKLESEGYIVIFFNYANKVKKELLDFFKEKNETPLKINKSYNLNTLISEEYNSPNNNFPWLFYYENNQWNNFLNVRATKYLMDGKSNLKIIENIEDSYFKPIYSYICETKKRDELAALGYTKTKERKILFLNVISKYEFDNRPLFIEDTPVYDNKAESLIVDELTKIYNSFQENIVVSTKNEK